MIGFVMPPLSEMKENRSRTGHEKAAWAEERARAELQRLGFSVEPPGKLCEHSTDLVAVRGVRHFHVEVKLAIWNKRAWLVKRVTRTKDEVIAIVFPSGAVHFEDMKTHLALCSRSGDRHLTALGRFFE